MKKKDRAQITSRISLGLCIFGSAWIAVNFIVPDDSRWLGWYFLLAGIAGMLGKKKQIIQGLVVLNLTLAAVWMTGEAAIRIYMKANEKNFVGGSFEWVSDKDIKYAFRPGAVYGRGRVNSRGFWDKEYPEKKPKGVFRIVLLGDSVTAEGAYPRGYYGKQLENMLNRCGGPVRHEVLNFGVPGYNTRQEVKTLINKAVRYDPDFILVGYVLNDAAPGLFIGGYITGHSKIITYLEQSTRLSIYFIDRANKSMETGFAYMYNNRAWWEETVGWGFDELEKIGRGHNAPVAVAIFPLLSDFDNAHFKAIHKKVGNEALRHGFDVIDLLPAYSKYKPRDLIRKKSDITHPNLKGHALAAGEIFRKLGKHWRCASPPEPAQ